MGATMLTQMSWQEGKAFIEGRLNRLQMCKMGAIATDVHEQIEKLGSRPRYTKAEKATIEANLAEEIFKKCKVTKSMIKKHDGRASSIAYDLECKISKVREGAFIHPDEKAWEEKHKVLGEQKTAREAQCEADFRDCLDDFILGSKQLDEFPTVYNEMEARAW